MYGIPARIIAMIVGAVLLIVGLALLVNSCQANRSLKKQNEVRKEQGQASIGAGSVAVNTVGGVMSNDAATDAAVSQGQAAIHAAPQGQKGKVSRKVACGFKSAANNPECKGPVK